MEQVKPEALVEESAEPTPVESVSQHQAAAAAPAQEPIPAEEPIEDAPAQPESESAAAVDTTGAEAASGPNIEQPEATPDVDSPPGIVPTHRPEPSPDVDPAPDSSPGVEHTPDSSPDAEPSRSPSPEVEPTTPDSSPDLNTAVDEASPGPTVEMTAEELLPAEPEPEQVEANEAVTMAILEAIVYVTDEPLSFQQIASALGKPAPEVQKLLDRLVAEYDKPYHGLSIKEVAGGYKMATKPEHHEAVRAFVKNLNPPMKLSMAALETLAVIAYKQPLTAPEIMEIRGVQGAGVLKTLLDRKLITTAGRKNVVGKPILYKTTKDFLVQFGLKDLNELPSLKEFEEIRRLALDDGPPGTEDIQVPVEEPPPTPEPPVEEPEPEPQPLKSDE